MEDILWLQSTLSILTLTKILLDILAGKSSQTLLNPPLAVQGRKSSGWHQYRLVHKTRLVSF
jgi:hypothetical protein